MNKMVENSSDNHIQNLKESAKFAGKFALTFSAVSRRVRAGINPHRDEKSQDSEGENWRKQSSAFLFVEVVVTNVVAMGVLDRAKQVSGLSDADGSTRPYVCLACETAFEVQHHSCPVCGSFDVRCSRWVQE